MVKVKIKFKQDHIVEMKVNDHAGSALYGQDLVCAGVSSICVGILNALDELCNGTCDFQMKEAHVGIIVKNLDCDKTQLILQTMYIQLLTMEQTYSKFIQITKVEV